MKYFFINLVLSIFFILPNQILRILLPIRRQKIRGQYLDYQAATFIKIMNIFGYKTDLDNFSDIERSRVNLSRLKIKINEKTANKFSVINHSLNHANGVSIRE
tara:strand:+ start:544 stop:852 length:309 start_codon:yes stop_codon:yes gene_type:complete